MRGLVASPAARLATATATASDGPQGHLHPLSSLRYFGANGLSALATDSATYVGSRRPRNLLFSRRSQPTPLSLSEVEAHRSDRVLRTATGWSVSASECTIEEADSECPRFQSAVIQPPLLQLTATALWPRSSEGSSVREQAKWLSKHLRGAVALVICR
jgi:hypothetical protein